MGGPPDDRREAMCENCAYFVPKSDVQGECRISPPTAFLMMVDADPAMAMVLGEMPAPTPTLIGGFPPVGADKWCAAHSDADDR